MSVADLLTDATRRLKHVGIESARLDARVLLSHVLERRASDALDPQLAIDQASAERFQTLLRRREAREPLAYIVGHKEFWSLDFEVGPGVLVPRPETETLVEELLRQVPDRNAAQTFLDLGTGSGCLLLAALSEYPRAVGTGVDASEEALAWARRNVAKLGLTKRCQLNCANWDEAAGGPYDAILANPPYIRASDVAALAREVSRYEPVPALDGGPDGLAAFREIAPKVASRLKSSGVLLAEIGEDQSAEVAAILAAVGIETVKIVEDLAGIPRCVVGRHRNR